MFDVAVENEDNLLFFPLCDGCLQKVGMVGLDEFILFCKMCQFFDTYKGKEKQMSDVFTLIGRMGFKIIDSIPDKYVSKETREFGKKCKKVVNTVELIADTFITTASLIVNK